jgi:hypothetical protein
LHKAIVNQEKIQKKFNLFTLQGIAEGGGLSFLKKDPFEQYQENFNSIYQTTFRQLIPISSINDFNQKYFDTFGSQREASLLTYAGRLNPDFDSSTLQKLLSY